MKMNIINNKRKIMPKLVNGKIRLKKRYKIVYKQRCKM